ncbi:NADPH-dependent ferric siderophore reductase [Halopolyspora algeriensis]|uniref:NADPH-dependent ferric siderophore reductase n=1 Tax=Halopolyspora algeriensis TaxID=1500506 RepID=A0A368VGE8_9ACTN|nr:NADPH-dependent ferric siderophore reductase [Halopolyspora algeriensis]TQM46272.1 NADPH-dependent ferric siderophore reductase [Halopolyspora algeriensis]
MQARYRLLDVRAVERITPRMVRVTLGGEELADFTDKGTDQRIKLCLPEPGRPAPLGRTRAEVFALPREQQPRQRTYTVRHVDAHRRELMVDLVLHDHIGPGASWAANVRPGDRIVTVGPSPSYQPSPEANPLVLAGDETALPAISAIVEQLPRATPVRVFVEIADGEEQQEIATVADVEWTWLHRDGIPAGRSSLLTEAVRTAELGTHPHVWIGAESDTVRELRAHFQDVLGWQRRRVYALAYWRRDRAER